MSFSISTERLVLEDLTEADLVNIQRIARDPGVMKYVMIWLENDEQIAAFHRHALEEAKRPDRLNYTMAARVRGTSAFAGLAFILVDVGIFDTYIRLISNM